MKISKYANVLCALSGGIIAVTSLISCNGGGGGSPMPIMSIKLSGSSSYVGLYRMVEAEIEPSNSNVRISFVTDNQNIALDSSSCTIKSPNTTCFIGETGVTPGVTTVTASASGYYSESMVVVVRP